MPDNKRIDYYVIAEALTGRRLTRDELFPWLPREEHQCATFERESDAAFALANYDQANSQVNLTVELVVLGCNTQGRVLTMDGRSSGGSAGHPCCCRNPLTEDTTTHCISTETQIMHALQIDGV